MNAYHVWVIIIVVGAMAGSEVIVNRLLWPTQKTASQWRRMLMQLLVTFALLIAGFSLFALFI